MIWRELTSGDVTAKALAVAGKGFYSADDGKSWFVDDTLKGSPIDRNGSLAYRAIVFRCPGGKPFVAYLARYSQDQLARIASDAAQYPGQPSEGQMGGLRSIKKPGESNWVANSSTSITGYPIVHCPGTGSADASLVLPSDPDSGAAD